MAGPFTESWMGYKREVTYGTRVRAGTPADTTTKVYGTWKNPFPVIAEKPTLVEYSKSGSFDKATQAYGNTEVRFQLASNLLDPVRIFEKVLGVINTTGPASSLYTHTVTGLEPAVGAVLPSDTYHLQTEGLTDDFIQDIPGCYSEEVNLGYVAKEVGIECLEKVLAQRITDENATTDLDGVGSAGTEDDAKAYTNAPTLGTGVTEEDPFYLSSLSEAGNDIVNDVLACNFKIKNTFTENRTSRPNKTDNYGKSINGYLSSAYLKDRNFEIALDLMPTDATLNLWDKLKTKSIDTDIVAVFKRQTKTNDKEHTITLTYDTSSCPVTDISGTLPFVHSVLQKWIIVLKPKTLVNAVLVDESSGI